MQRACFTTRSCTRHTLRHYLNGHNSSLLINLHYGSSLYQLPFRLRHSDKSVVSFSSFYMPPRSAPKSSSQTSASSTAGILDTGILIQSLILALLAQYVLTGRMNMVLTDAVLRNEKQSNTRVR